MRFWWLSALFIGLIGAVVGVVSGSAISQNRPEKTPSVFDLQLGAHVSQLPARVFADISCGTNGGPPSLPLEKYWLDYAKCAPETATGLREVYFRYDDELEYVARARRMTTQAALFGGTTVYGMPVVASGLFDDNGFLVGFRLVSDPRGLTAEQRALHISLWNFLRGRYGEDWACEDLPRAEGEQPYGGQFLKRKCEMLTPDQTQRITIHGNYFRKAGQFGIDPRTQLGTEGQFESSARLEVLLVNPIEDPDRILAELEPIDLEPDPVAERARACPGCDLSGVDLKRRDLRNADLAGANLSNANLHGANLSGANLSGANLNRADMKRANLAGADLSGAMLFTTRLDGANLANANLNGALAGSVQMIGANLQSATIQLVDLRDARLTAADFSGADLTGSHLHYAHLRGAVLSGSTMAGVIAIQALMDRVDFTGANLEGMDLFSADLREANFTDANLSGARLSGAVLDGATFEGAVLEETELPVGFQRP